PAATAGNNQQRGGLMAKAKARIAGSVSNTRITLRKHLATIDPVRAELRMAIRTIGAQKQRISEMSQANLSLIAERDRLEGVVAAQVTAMSTYQADLELAQGANETLTRQVNLLGEELTTARKALEITEEAAAKAAHTHRNELEWRREHIETLQAEIRGYCRLLKEMGWFIHKHAVGVHRG
ncbi:MAG: hypothetical protein KGK08_15095, partial [Acidobacteriota bacterium]|nr:hypothetical protein [Acidobacteriota bacterium]